MALLESVFNHLVLPPKLPGRLDPDNEGIEYSILTRLIRACDILGKFAGQEFAQTWASIRHSLRVCLNAGRFGGTPFERPPSHPPPLSHTRQNVASHTNLVCRYIVHCRIH